MELNLEKPIKKRRCKPEDETRGNGLDRLPNDIALDILLRLPVISLLQSSFVCRSWHNLRLNHNLATLHLSQAVNRDPLLIFHSDYPLRNELCFTEFPASDDDEKTVKKISTPFSASMPEFIIEGSCNGLLCLSDTLYREAVYIYNPLTRDYSELPKTRQYEDQTVVCGFGYHPGTQEYKVVKIVHHRITNFGYQYVERTKRLAKLRSEVLVFTLGGNAWKNVGRAPFSHVDWRSRQALCTNGRLHWLSFGEYNGEYNNIRGLIIVSFDLADDNFHEVPRPDFSVIDGRNYHLAVLRGCLSAAVFEHGLRRDLEIWVMKEYNVKESWTKEFKFKGYVPDSPWDNSSLPVRIRGSEPRRLTLKVLCVLENGGILIEYRSGRLAVYDPEAGRFEIMKFKGMPSLFRTVVHTGSLNSIALPIQL
ncbi:hypothetical protein ACET3Z_020588 [Daucus carota]